MSAGDRAGVPQPDLTLIVDGANVVGSRPDGWWRDRAGAAVRLYDELAGLAERGAAGIPAAQLATGEDGQAPAGPEQTGNGQSGSGQAGPGQGGTGQADPKQASSGQAGIRQADTGQAGTGQADTGQADTGHAGTGQAGTRQDGPQTVAVVLVLEGAAKAAAARIAARTAGDGRDRAGDLGTVQVVSAPGSGDDEIVRLARSRPGHRIVVTSDRELRRRSVAVGAQVAGPSWLRAQL
jgi:PPE-repeat protein